MATEPRANTAPSSTSMPIWTVARAQIHAWVLILIGAEMRPNSGDYNHDSPHTGRLAAR